MAAEEQSDRMASDMEKHMKQWCVTEPHHVEKMAPTDVPQWLMNVYGDHVDVCMVYWWVLHFSSGDREWVTSAGVDFDECSMQTLVHSWLKCIANGGAYVEE